MSKIIIDIRNDIDPEVALGRVKAVVEGGRVSKNNTLYCYSTVWSDDIVVAVRDHRKNDCFLVYKKGKLW